MAIGERDDDNFDFSEMIFGESSKDSKSKIENNPAPSVNKSEGSATLSNMYDTEVQSSYLLVNALLTLLIRKQVIYPHEVQTLIAELHIEYMKKKKGRGNDEAK